MFKKTRARVAAEVYAKLGAERVIIIDDDANFFGVESRGKWQIRGNGCLAATADEMLYIMWWPRRELRIRCDRIAGIERARSHLGKTVGRELLHVRFTNDEGQPDSVAWWVGDLGAWERALEP